MILDDIVYNMQVVCNTFMVLCHFTCIKIIQYSSKYQTKRKKVKQILNYIRTVPKRFQLHSDNGTLANCHKTDNPEEGI